MVNAVETKAFANVEGTVQIHEVESPHFFRLRVAGALTLDAYKEAFNELREHMVSEKCPRLLYDARELSASDPEARAWLVKTYFPEVTRVFEEPLVAALVLPKSMFMKMVIKIVAKAMRTFGKSFVLQSFDDEEQAVVWLEEQQRTSQYS